MATLPFDPFNKNKKIGETSGLFGFKLPNLIGQPQAPISPQPTAPTLQPLNVGTPQPASPLQTPINRPAPIAPQAPQATPQAPTPQAPVSPAIPQVDNRQQQIDMLTKGLGDISASLGKLQVPTQAPQAPTPQPPASDAILKQLLAGLTPSEQEVALANQITDLEGATNLGVSGLEGQGRGIPLDLVRGQQAQLQEQGLLKQQTLQQKLAIEQAKRQAGLDVSKFSLDRADKAEERARDEAQAGDKVIEVDGQLVQRQSDGSFKSVFGTPKGSEGFTLGKDQVRFDDEGNIIASNIGSEGLSSGFGSGYARGQNPTVDSWVDNINAGRAKFSDIKDEGLRNAVSNAMVAGGSSEQDNVKAQVLQDKIDTISSLIDHRGMSKSVGPTGLGRFTPFKADTWTGDVQDFVAGVHQLTSRETLDYLINLKAQGGTLGALNQSELDILKGSATKINDWEIKDKNNEPTGKWNISESLFKKELNNLLELTQRAMSRVSGGAPSTTPTEVEGESDYEAYLRSIGA